MLSVCRPSFLVPVWLILISQCHTHCGTRLIDTAPRRQRCDLGSMRCTRGNRKTFYSPCCTAALPLQRSVPGRRGLRAQTPARMRWWTPLWRCCTGTARRRRLPRRPPRRPLCPRPPRPRQTQQRNVHQPPSPRPLQPLQRPLRVRLPAGSSSSSSSRGMGMRANLSPRAGPPARPRCPPLAARATAGLTLPSSRLPPPPPLLHSTAPPPQPRHSCRRRTIACQPVRSCKPRIFVETEPSSRRRLTEL